LKGEVLGLNCDICGREIVGQAFKVKVEGAKMLVCRNCQALGTPYQEDPAPQRARSAGFVRSPRLHERRPVELPKEVEELDVAENFSDLVRKRRMKLGWSQEDLARKVKEKLSVIQKIETGKITPDTQLCRRLQHELKVKLLVPRKEAPAPKIATPAEVTLGDIVKIKGRPDSFVSD
jgi:putative transcription factor